MISKEERVFAFKSYDKLNGEYEQNLWLLRYCHRKERITAKKKPARHYRVRIGYMLPISKDKCVNVCFAYFCKAMNFHSKVSSRVARVMGRAEDGNLPKTKRGCFERTHHNQVTEKVMEHILSFNPTVGHYNRHKAPNR